MNSIKLKAYAKINLGLDVVRKREDGYHEVRMIMQTIGLYDKVSILRTNNTSITVKTNLPYLPTDENNLVYKAAALIKKNYGITQGVHIILDKKIPVAAGLAGGSSDAAAVLYGLNRLFHLNLSKEELSQLGLQLGADVPYCLLRGTALSEGIGEILTPVPPFPSCHILIVKPGINVSTKHVYEHLKLEEDTLHPNIDAILAAINKKDLKAAVSHFGNVLESVTIKEYPVIGQIKEELTAFGAIVAMMSGSGPTVFGLFDRREKAEKAFYQLKAEKSYKQVFLTGLYQPGLKF